MEDLARYLGYRISDFRRLCGLTQKQLAEKTGLTVSYISKLERGVRLPALNVLRNIALALGVPTDWLLYDVLREGSRPPAKLMELAGLSRSRRTAAIRQMEAVYQAHHRELEAALGAHWQDMYPFGDTGQPLYRVFALFYLYDQLKMRRKEQ